MDYFNVVHNKKSIDKQTILHRLIFVLLGRVRIQPTVKRFKKRFKRDYKRGGQNFPPKKLLLFSPNRFANFTKLEN